MRYVITAPERRFSGEVAGVAFFNGRAEADDAQHVRALAYFRRKGYDVQPVADISKPEVDAAQADEPREGDGEERQRPAKNASKDDLVAYAVAELGMTEDDAKAKTRVELLDLIDKHDKESEQ
jgi:hypothetical protein